MTPDFSRLHSTEPTDSGTKNAIRRARQLTELRWQVIRDTMPGRERNENGERVKFYHKPGIEYVGIPYSSVYMTNNYVGTTILPESFISALCNPNSVLYTHDLSDNECGEVKATTWYGMVCSKFVAYVLGIEENYNTQHFFNIEGMRKIADKGQYRAEDIALCDVLLCPRKHVVIITDILRDDDGAIAAIEISESTNRPHMRRIIRDLPDFFAYAEPYDLYRYDGLSGVTYEPNALVHVFDETQPLDDRRYDVLNRRGDKTNFPVSDKPIVLDILTDGWETAVVEKDGEPFCTADVRGCADFSLSRSECGFYTVYLTDKSGRKSRPAYHCVTDRTVSVTALSEGSIRVECSCSSGSAIWVQIGTIGDSLYRKIGGNGVHTLSFDPADITERKARVSFKNAYGQYVSDFLPF